MQLFIPVIHDVIYTKIFLMLLRIYQVLEEILAYTIPQFLNQHHEKNIMSGKLIALIAFLLY